MTPHRYPLIALTRGRTFTKEPQSWSMVKAARAPPDSVSFCLILLETVICLTTSTLLSKGKIPKSSP